MTGKKVIHPRREGRLTRKVVLIAAGVVALEAACAQTLSPMTVKGWTADVGYEAFAFTPSEGAAFNVYIAGTPSEERTPIVVAIQGSGCASNFRLRDGRPRSGMDRIRSLAVQPVEFAVPDRPGVQPLDDPEDAGLAINCSDAFRRNSSLDGIASGIAQLIRALVARRSGQPDYVLVFGGSDGAQVAALVASQAPEVTHVAMVGGGGDNQLQELLLLPPPVEAKVADENEWIRGVFELYRDAHRGSPEDEHWGQAAVRWRSAFSLSIRAALLSSSSRIYLVSGSEDASAPIKAMDLLASDLIRAGRDVTVQRVLGAEHSLIVKGNDPGVKQREVIGMIMRWAAGIRPYSSDIVWPLPLPNPPALQDRVDQKRAD